MSAIVHSEKSTNVRTGSDDGAKVTKLSSVRRAQFLVWQGAMRWAGRLAPDLAARWADRLFFTPRRFPQPFKEQLDLASAHRFSFVAQGRELTAWEWGVGAPVVLMHGWEGRGAQLAAVVPELVAAGFKVVAFDAPAHGMSPGKRTNVLEMSAALEALARELGPLHAIVAHSLGCMAVTLALDHGLDVRRLAYVAPWSTLPSATRTFGEKAGIPVHVMERVRTRMQKRFADDWQRLDGLALAKRMSTPLLIVHDRDDREVSFAEGQALQECWSGAALFATDKLGHRRVLRHPEAVSRIASFVEHGDTEVHQRDGWREVLVGA
jgi:pimeloyl-ACP methyl ester carboxylesterase